MLDYSLVGTKATYRMITPRDVPDLARLVQAFYREDQPGTEMTPERFLATVRELQADKGKGTIFVFDSEESLVGYCILINYWSNELGGTVLCVDELFVVPERRGRGIATEFLGLIAKVAPEGCRALQLEAGARNRRAQRLYGKLGFTDTGRRVLSRGIRTGAEG
jgi:diamine N-acetyltransferase